MAVRIENQAEPIPGYRLIERIGGGGFGEVWKCEAPGGLHKAIKFVFGDLGSANDDGHRAEQELKALSRVKTVRHPYILSLERYDLIDGQLVIVMELADRNLWDRFKECRSQGLPGIPRDELLRYLEETAEALDLMNEQYQLQHLDIKPQNLFLVHNHIKVADFGLVKDLHGMQASVTGGVTPVYASPETFDGYISRFSDQYSLAIVYEEMLTGKRPFASSNVRQLIMQHLQAPPNLEPLPPADRPAIARALAKSPDDRHATCRTLLQLLRAATSAPVSAEVSPTRQRGDEVRTDQPPPPALRLPPSNPRPLAFDLQPLSSGEGEDEDSDAPLTTHLIRGVDSASSPAAILARNRAEIPAVSSRRAPPEAHGDGVLMPALIIGLGQIGLQVLQQAREALAAGLGSLAAVPHLRFLLLDTDPEVVPHTAPNLAGGQTGAGLTPADVLLAPLNRPSYYLKNRDAKPHLETWFNPRMLYRIPRSQVTTGVRALGRLAWCDNYRHIVRRLRAELEVLFDPQALALAARNTKLGVRTNVPRIWVVTSLAGGTGGGMFLDLAYTVRALLRETGCERPDVASLLLLPPVDRNRTRELVLGNAYAALTELNHFARPDTCFRAQYLERETIEDRAPPFGRCVVLSLPEETDEVAMQEVAGQAGQFLYRDLCSPLGRTADLARAGLSNPSWEARGQYGETFGLFRLSWPRRALFGQIGRRLCQQVVSRWMSKDSKPIREAVQTWVQEQWASRELGADVFLDQLVQACVVKLQQPPESAFKAILQPLVDRCAPGTGSAPGTKPAAALPPRAPSRAGAVAEIPAADVATVLGQLEELLGDPADDSPPEEGPRLVQLLREASDEVVQAWGQKLDEMPVHLIEEPSYRLAGAEEAVRQLVATIEQALQHHEPLLKDLNAKAREAHIRLRSLAQPPSQTPNRRRPPPAADVLDLMRSYAKWRYQSLVLGQFMSSFLTLRGHLADEMREIGFCRVRLTELHRLLAEPIEPEADKPRDGGRHLFPPGCQGLADAVKAFLADVGPEAIGELDVCIESMLRKRFTALVQVCVGRANLLKDVLPALVETAETFAAGLRKATNVAEMFLEQHPDPQAEGEVAGFLDEAAPGPLGHRPPPGTAPEVCVVAAPAGAAGDRVRELARKAAPGTEVHTAAPSLNSADEIVIYRELSNVPLADLEQLGPVGQEAYDRMTSAENFTPHSRTDVRFLSQAVR